MSSRIHSTRCHALNKQKMGTSLCDVTMTLTQQEKIGKNFFLTQDTFSTRKCIFDIFTQNAHGITQRPTVNKLLNV